MSCCEYKNSDRFISNVADQPVIAYTIAPQTAFLTLQRLSPLSWVIGSLYVLTKEADDPLLRLAIQLLDLFLGAALDLNDLAPIGRGQVSAPVRRG